MLGVFIQIKNKFQNISSQPDLIIFEDDFDEFFPYFRNPRIRLSISLLISITTEGLFKRILAYSLLLKSRKLIFQCFFGEFDN